MTRLAEAYPLEGLDSPSLNTNYLWTLSIHEHEAPTKQGFLSELIESIVAKSRNEYFIGRKSLLMPVVDFQPVFLSYVVEHNIHGTVVIANKNVPVIHVQRVHVWMGMKYLVQNIFGKSFRLLFREAIFKQYTSAMCKDRKVF